MGFLESCRFLAENGFNKLLIVLEFLPCCCWQRFQLDSSVRGFFLLTVHSNFPAFLSCLTIFSRLGVFPTRRNVEIISCALCKSVYLSIKKKKSFGQWAEAGLEDEASDREGKRILGNSEVWGIHLRMLKAIDAWKLNRGNQLDDRT